MAQIDEKSGGRDTNVELNLVPFIDLMSVCIIFLLLTAVWTQVSMIQIGSSMYAKKIDGDQSEPPPVDKITFQLKVKSTGYLVMINSASVQIPKVAGAFDDKRLLTYLQQVKQKYPQKNDAIISLDDEIIYEEMIRGMDVLMLSGFAEISVATAGG
ncbi:MAG: ExbD/TolR family protein [Bdellovibrionales bacterium]